jgi:hypothetical protein
MPRGEPSLKEWTDIPIVEKPASPHTLASAVRVMAAARPSQRQLRR